jgi:hypothetical protein
MSLQVIYDLLVASEKRATVVDNGLAGVKVRFLIKDKQDIMREIKKAELGFPEVCTYLAGKGLPYSTWNSRFYTWQKDWESGKLDIGLAIAVQRKKPGRHHYRLNPLHETLAEMLKEGRSLAEIESSFVVAFARIKDDITKAAVDSVETILKSRGLTLDDLKKAL